MFLKVSEESTEERRTTKKRSFNEVHHFKLFSPKTSPESEVSQPLSCGFSSYRSGSSGRTRDASSIFKAFIW